ncbi:unnamed protein product, partial [Brassica oleracea]
MDVLPRDLMHKILFMIDHRSVAMMRCTNRSLQTHINDPYFKSEYSSRVGSGLVHISASGSSYLSYNPNGDSRSLKTKDTLKESHILGSCSGLLLVFIDDRLCVVNPVTKKFRYFNQSWFMRFTGVFSHTGVVNRGNKKHIGLVVDRTTKSFKIVHMVDVGTDYESRYKFEINGENSWRRPKTTLTCLSSVPLKTPVYLERSLHWLRNDGSIVSFNLETEHARLIPTSFPRGLSLKTLFTLGNNGLTLISATEEYIYVYSLENILRDPKWVFVKKIQNIMMDKKKLSYWNLEAYNGKCLLLREYRAKEEEPLFCDQVVHVYDLSTNKWVVMGSIPGWCSVNHEFFQFTPSTSYVVGLDEILPWAGGRISSLSTIMALIDGSSSEKVEKQLGKDQPDTVFFSEQSA